METTNQITFRIGEETKPVIVCQDDFKESLLGEQIAHAYDCVMTMVKECSQDKALDVSPFSDVYHNNIISYVGERGSGKTSCMYSVASMLTQKHGDIFLCLDAIDPSFFDEHHNILQIVIGKMYRKFDTSLQNLSENKIKEHETMNLRRCFMETKKHLRYLDKEPEFVDDNEMEDLSQLASGIDLKRSVQKLVGEFLKFYGKTVLLISIDDIDQNFSRAYEMAEQLRKYLIIPGVVIQMAAKMDQLMDMIQNKMAAQYDNLRNEGMDVDYRGMAERYLVKLLPLESRIFMPAMDIFFETPLKIIDGDKVLEIGDVKTTVTQLIFQKCRYLFYNTRGTTSYIVPRNLRELRMLVSMLVRMPDYHYIGKDGKILRSEDNKNVFKNYFFNDWMSNLEESSKNIAKELLNEKEPTRFNKKVVHILTESYISPYLPHDLPAYIIAIVKENTASYNVSLGDVFTFMDYLSRINTQEDTSLLLFFIKSLYSIRLFEYYDLLVGNLNGKSQEIDIPKPFRKDDFLENVSYLQKFVAGSYYYISGESLITKAADQPIDNQRELRTINGTVLNSLIRDLCSRHLSIASKSIEEKIKFTQDLQMAEFFMLTVSRFVFSKTGGKESGDYRQSTDAFYARDLSRVSNMEFNVMAPFFHLLDVKNAYRRFNSSIFEIAKQWNDEKTNCISLYNLILKECNTRKELGAEHNMLSRIAIRNAEIAEDLYAYMERHKFKYRPDNGEIGVLADFYHTLFNYQIATYDIEKDVASKNSTIRYIPFKVLSEYLIKCTNQEKFYSIYNDALVKEITPYRYVDKSMTRMELMGKLDEMYPNLLTDSRQKDFMYRFQKEKKYNRTAIITKLDGLSKLWELRLDGTTSTNG